MNFYLTTKLTHENYPKKSADAFLGGAISALLDALRIILNRQNMKHNIAWNNDTNGDIVLEAESLPKMSQLLEGLPESLLSRNKGFKPVEYCHPYQHSKSEPFDWSEMVIPVVGHFAKFPDFRACEWFATISENDLEKLSGLINPEIKAGLVRLSPGHGSLGYLRREDAAYGRALGMHATRQLIDSLPNAE